MSWNGTYQQPTFALPPQGNYRARVKNAVWAVSKKGNPMIVITLAISAHNETVNYWIASDIGVQIFTRSFNLDPFSADFNHKEKINSWIGAEGGINISHEQSDTGVLRAVAKPLSQKQTTYLAPFIAPQQAQQPQQQQPQNFSNFEQNGFAQPQQQQRHDFNANTTNLSNPEIPF